jgi:hypothetical protein
VSGGFAIEAASKTLATGRRRVASIGVLSVFLAVAVGAQDSRSSAEAAFAKTAWEALPGLDPAPAFPCAMFEADGRLHVLSEERAATFDLQSGAWNAAFASLPARVGDGLSAAYDAASKKAYVFQGGSRGFWRYDPKSGAVEKLADLRRPTGRGAALTVFNGKVYALRGALSRDFFVYDPATNAWTQLPKVGGDKVSVVGCGFTSGFLVADATYVYAWPDHHIQRFDPKTGEWFERTWTSMGFRPNCDGGAFAFDDETKLLYAAQGMNSRSLGVYDPPKQGPGFKQLRPRLPEPLYGEGSRGAIATTDGVKRLYVYAPKPGNRLWRIALSDLDPIDGARREADVGSPYETFHEDNGSSLVRRPGPSGIEGVLGAYKDRFFFMRLDGLRLCDPVKDEWSSYPGSQLGSKMSPGPFGVHDGGDYVYYSTGGGAAKAKAVFGRMNPTTKETLELPPPPKPFGRGSRAARVGSVLYALRGGAERDVFRFDMASNVWSTIAPLPKEAAGPGAVASGLVADGTTLYAFPDETIYSLDVSRPDAAWTKVATAAWCCGIDGGMTALDDVGRAIYMIRGDVTRDIGRLDLKTGLFEVLKPDLPDVVSVEGERAVVRESDGERRLFVMRGHDTHEIWRVPLSALRPKA